MAERILRKPAVLERVPVSSATLYRWIARGRFPAPVKLGPNVVGWKESDVSAWIESREKGSVRTTSEYDPAQVKAKR